MRCLPSETQSATALAITGALSFPPALLSVYTLRGRVMPAEGELLFCAFSPHRKHHGSAHISPCDSEERGGVSSLPGHGRHVFTHRLFGSPKLAELELSSSEEKKIKDVKVYGSVKSITRPCGSRRIAGQLRKRKSLARAFFIVASEMCHVFPVGNERS